MTCVERCWMDRGRAGINGFVYFYSGRLHSIDAHSHPRTCQVGTVVSNRRSSAWLLARGFGRPYGSCEPPWKSVIANKSQPISPGVELKPDCDYDRPVRRGRYTECGGAALRVLAPSPFSPWLVSSPPGLSRSLALRDGFAFGWGVRAAWA